MAEFRPFSADDFRQRVARRMSGQQGAIAGDHSWNPDLAETFLRMERQPAAVLVAVVAHQPEATMLLTERTNGLRSHAGQIAFPGGRIDAEDAGPEAAAVREAQEEIGLDPSRVETLAVAPDYLTGSGYRVAPVLAVVRPPLQLTLNPAEVADAFEVPLSFLMDPANHRRGSRVWQGATRFFFEMPYQNRYIWGVTAGILRALYERLYAEERAEHAL